MQGVHGTNRTCVKTGLSQQYLHVHIKKCFPYIVQVDGWITDTISCAFVFILLLRIFISTSWGSQMHVLQCSAKLVFFLALYILEIFPRPIINAMSSLYYVDLSASNRNLVYHTNGTIHHPVQQSAPIRQYPWPLHHCWLLPISSP